jgi:hypothetical protein
MLTAQTIPSAYKRMAIPLAKGWITVISCVYGKILLTAALPVL